jgi:hypothetical protein
VASKISGLFSAKSEKFTPVVDIGNEKNNNAEEGGW